MYSQSYIRQVLLRVMFPQLVSPPLFPLLPLSSGCAYDIRVNISTFLYSVYPHCNQHGQTLYFSSCPHFRYGLSAGFFRRLPTVGVSLIALAL